VYGVKWPLDDKDGVVGFYVDVPIIAGFNLMESGNAEVRQASPIPVVPFRLPALLTLTIERTELCCDLSCLAVVVPLLSTQDLLEWRLLACLNVEYVGRASQKDCPIWGWVLNKLGPQEERDGLLVVLAFHEQKGLDKTLHWRGRVRVCGLGYRSSDSGFDVDFDWPSFVCTVMVQAVHDREEPFGSQEAFDTAFEEVTRCFDGRLNFFR
jgi:hypothetical protein